MLGEESSRSFYLFFPESPSSFLHSREGEMVSIQPDLLQLEGEWRGLRDSDLSESGSFDVPVS